MSKKILIIMNPVAGVKKPNKVLTEIISMFSDNDYIVQIQTTTPSVGADKLAVKYAKGNDIVMCIGGDGTLNEMLSGLMEANLRPKIGYIPSGSTNDFAKGLKIPGDPLKAAKNVLEGSIRTLDAGSFNGRIFNYTASFGIFTKTSYNTSRAMKNRLGYLAYVLEGTKELSSIKSYHIKLTADNQVIEGDYLFGAICNTIQIGGGFIHFKKSPINMNDGLLDILLIKYPKNPIEASQMFFDLKQEKFNPQYFDFLSAKDITVETNDEIDWTLDGEYQKGNNIVTINTIKDAIHLLMPDNSNKKQ